MSQAEPFEIHVPQETLDDLKERLDRTRWPNELPGVGERQGIPEGFFQELLAYWRDGFDWRAQEARINALPNFRVEIEGLGVHFIHVRGKGPAPMPLLLAHGYPSSPFEYLPLISLLTDPAAHGGDPADAFDVVVPSVPGHGFSDLPDRVGFEDRAVSGMFVELMVGLGYERFGIHAYDIGASICEYLNFDHPERVIGYHTTTPGIPGPTLAPESPPLSVEELEHQKLRQTWGGQQGAYAHILGTKHQVLAHGLNDSPAGLAAWIIDKWQSWTVPPTGNLEEHFSKDDLLANVTTYWVTETINSANRYYAEDLEPLGPDDRITVPTGVALPFNEPSNRPPREYVERLHTDIRHWVELDGGGHFVAGEMPGPVAESIRTFFRELRDVHSHR